MLIRFCQCDTDKKVSESREEGTSADELPLDWLVGMSVWHCWLMWEGPAKRVVGLKGIKRAAESGPESKPGSSILSWFLPRL